MKKYKQLIILLNLLLLLFYFNYSVISKEELLSNGQLVLLELAPVDPRSLMQGDYMDLRYSISENMGYDTIPKRGYCVVVVDENNVATRVRFQRGRTPLSEGEAIIEYTASDPWNVRIGAESYFFQEGHAERYEVARYGGVRIDQKGNSLLVGLYDETLKKIQ